MSLLLAHDLFTIHTVIVQYIWHEQNIEYNVNTLCRREARRNSTFVMCYTTISHIPLIPASAKLANHVPADALALSELELEELSCPNGAGLVTAIVTVVMHVMV